MHPELKEFYETAELHMSDAVDFLHKEFSGIRAGKANPALLDTIKVDYYGNMSPINQVANVSAPEPRMLVVQPWDKGMIPAIEKAIRSSALGLNPNNDGNIIRIPLPILSEERRQELVKIARDLAEQARVSIRNSRRDAKDHVKNTVKDKSLPEDSRFEAEDDIQKLTDQFIEKVDSMLKDKEHEILSI
jgi:ribosome recycling factor